METYDKKHSTINQMGYRLERNYTKLKSLVVKLNSYRCEPKDYDFFERLRDIRDDIAKFKNQHSKLCSESSLGQFGSKESHSKQIREHLTSFNELNLKIG